MLQLCRDHLQVLPGSSTDTWPVLSDGTLDVSYIYLEEDVNVNVRAEKDIGSEEEKFMDVNDDEHIYVYVDEEEVS
jgi:hypothetical protein